MNTPRAQDLNEVIRGVCQSFVDPEYLEYFGDRDELLTTETGFSSDFPLGQRGETGFLLFLFLHHHSNY
ncbi:uncharacterized protein AKAME5_000107800 [Lates japonicus]|uniref:Uncharacterized protein n=1 Tax=Lates japonicus TaxID=270547 RepID=A0AAD3QX42_LATJO|nr:uncharacterized protein AKAME5_000107800 [Lates japonicus]